MGVSGDFESFCGNLIITNTSDISQRYRTITWRLNKQYYGSESETAHSLYVGSYGRDTAIHNAHDMDMIFTLPESAYYRFNTYAGNKQSALLQEVRSALQITYPNTSIRGDGQVVVVNFSDGMRFEVVPVFAAREGGYIYPDTNGGGSWQITNPEPEMSALNARNLSTNGNLRRLCRMIRSWRRANSVAISGLQIDTFAYNFIIGWAHKDKSYLYYDYISRDFFGYLKNFDRNQDYWLAPGSGQRVYRKGPFESKAEAAYNNSLLAISYYSDDKPWSAKQKFREVYGSYFPS
ncbi:hypothetical protein HNQ07_003853 [Deinococcus metalli]|uniref:Nucleotidyltransferase n=1 Tax=Deinococcus metalli TaxID=1141878 RepID=A0A7W8KHT6_9DEIO|nr:nucleotidyltransferase [Deinococcus metalli]MBB5378347.1 hypothetical protein [Deinococcus metalli]GHF59541.1 hypothetical protein GCM10017781_39840 [Deinococcus metalli]